MALHLLPCCLGRRSQYSAITSGSEGADLTPKSLPATNTANRESLNPFLQILSKPCSECRWIEAESPYGEDGDDTYYTGVLRNPGYFSHSCEGCILLSIVQEGIRQFHKPGLQLVSLRDRTKKHYFLKCNGVVYWHPERGFESSSITLRVHTSKSSLSLEIVKLVKHNSSRSPWLPVNSVCFYAPIAHPSPCLLIGNARHIEPNSGSKSARDLTRSWLNSCIENHNNCPLERSTLPKRVLEIEKQLSGFVVRLRDGQGQADFYITLSHCWGSSNGAGPLKTTHTNINRRRFQIPWHELSKTFQDAITMTWKLGVRYIWIDSLCIIQDDAQDWQEQSSEMATIYEKAFLTIAATHASSGEEGCFSQKAVAKEVSKGVFARDGFHHYPWDSKNPYHHCFNAPQSDPLFTRAWCLQERLLSTRVLHYGSNEMVWECNDAVNCECGDLPVQDGAFQKINFYQASKQSANMNVWRDLVESYTAANLTREDDILPALSGIASKFQTLGAGRYLAGLWEKDLIRNLLWFSDGSSGRRKPTTYKAPSFSWASRIGKVSFFNSTASRLDSSRLVTILEGDCKVEGRNPLGTISYGYITIRGTLIPGKLATHEHHILYLYRDPQQFLQRLPEIREAFGAPFSEASALNRAGRARLDITHDERQLVYTDDEAYCLPVLMSSVAHGSAYSLILHKRADGIYERIGASDILNFTANWQHIGLPEEDIIIE